MKKSSNLKLWEEYGDHLLVVQPFMDSLIVSGDGCYLIDAEGRRILDMAAGQFCSILGHSHPRFIERLKQQLDSALHIGDQYVSPAVLAAASRLAGITPGNLNKVLFLSTGSEANECAMRMVKAVTGRTGMLAFTRGYYGSSLATRNLSSISDDPRKVDFQPAPPTHYKLITPTCHRCPIGLEYPACDAGCLDLSMDMIGEHAENIAGVIVETVVSAGGMIFPPKDYLRKLQERTHAIGALFIVDEAQTGFGRCGQWFDIQNLGLEPDLLVVSKTAANGLPAAAVIVSDDVAKTLETQGFMHLSSHQNDPLAAAAVHVVIDIVEDENLIERSREMGDYLVAKLELLKQKHEIVSAVRGRGLMVGLELEGSQELDVALKVALSCEREGVHITFSYFEPVIRFIPPLTISTSEIDQAVSTLDRVLDSLPVQSLGDLTPKNLRSGPFIEQMNRKFRPLALLKSAWNTPPSRWAGKVRKKLKL